MSITAGTLSLVSVDHHSASLAATAATAGTGPYAYQWYRSTTSGFTPGVGNLLSGATSLTLTDTGLVPGTQYYYVVIATDLGAGSATATYAQLPVLTLTTLRISYSGSLNSKLAEARQAGYDLIAVTNLTALQTALSTAAGRGQRKFTVNLSVSYQPVDLRGLNSCGTSNSSKCGCGKTVAASNCNCSCGKFVNNNGPLWPAFLSGIYAALADQDIMMDEVSVLLNTSDQVSTTVDLKFHL